MLQQKQLQVESFVRLWDEDYYYYVLQFYDYMDVLFCYELSGILVFNGLRYIDKSLF